MASGAAARSCCGARRGAGERSCGTGGAGGLPWVGRPGAGGALPSPHPLTLQPGQHPARAAPHWDSTQLGQHPVRAAGPCGTQEERRIPQPSRVPLLSALGRPVLGAGHGLLGPGVLSAGPCACKHPGRRRWSSCQPLPVAGLLLPSPVGPHYTTSVLPAAAAALHMAGLLGLFGGSRGCAGH